MRCDEIMKKEVVCVRPRDSVQHAAQLMHDEDVGFLPICDPQDRVIGTLTDRDITVRLVAEGRSSLTHCEEVMTPDVVSCAPEDDLHEAERLMREHHKSRMLVCDEDGRLKGVISLSDIAQYENDDETGSTLRGVSEREAHVSV